MVVFLCLCCLCFGNPLWAFWQSVVGILAICCGHFCNPSAALSQTVSSRREPIHRAHIYVFATHSQSVGTHLAIRQQHYRKPFEMPSRNVRNVFVFCVLHIHRAKVWFLRHKSMVFGVQKPPFWRARSGFLQSLN